jgi:salicylate hydroxylase
MCNNHRRTLSDVQLTFKDGEISSYDLVIGANGIHSFTRSQILRQPPSVITEKNSLTKAEVATLVKPKATYSGVTTIDGLVPASQVDSSLLAPLDTHQSIRTISPHAGLFAISYARSNRSVINWFSSRSPPTPPSPDQPKLSAEAVRNELLVTYSALPGPIPALIKATEKIYYWPVYRLAPMPEAWYSEQGRVVLVGDAAHAMPPHAVQGVGMGVEDALLVARIIAKLCTQSITAADIERLCSPRQNYGGANTKRKVLPV